MDEDEVQDLLQSKHNTTDELYDFNFELTAWDITRHSLLLVFTILGLLADIVIIYMIARNVRMRSKTNLLLMHFAINDALFLTCNVHFLVSAMQIFGIKMHSTFHTNCVVRIMDDVFYFNQEVFLLILVSNTLMKSKRIQIKWLQIATYSFIVANFVLNLILCEYHIYAIMFYINFGIFILNLAVVLFKEINNCYKIWYKKDPLSQRTRFRLTIGRIYIGCWFLTGLVYIFIASDDKLLQILAQNSFMTSFYILIYIVHADKNFKICFLNLMHCKDASNYNGDVAITLAEDYSED